MKALIIGLGGIGQRHARNLRRILGPELDLIALRTRRLSHVITPQLGVDNSTDVEEFLNIKAFSDLTDALAEKPDVAFITNPSSLHIEAALACARADCDLFIEKPLANTLDGVDKLLSTVRQRGLIAMVGYQLRFHPCFRLFAGLVQDGALGTVLTARALLGEYLPDWHKYEDYRQMYAARADLGGGVVLSQIHEYDYLYSLFGKPRRVFALGGTWSDLEIDVEDTVSALLECDWHGRPLPVHVQQDFVQKPAVRRCEVFGDQGRAEIDFVAATVTRWPTDGSTAISHSFAGFERNEMFLDELNHFLECVRTRSKPCVDLEDGKASLQVALAIKQSLIERVIVSVNDQAMAP